MPRHEELTDGPMPETVVIDGELELIERPQGPTMRITSLAQVQRRLMQVCPELVPVPLDATENEQVAIGTALREQTKQTRGAA